MKIYFLVIFNFKMDEDHDLLFPTNHIFAFCQAEIRETAWDAALPPLAAKTLRTRSTSKVVATSPPGS